MISVNFNPTVDAEKSVQLLNEIRQDPMGGWLDLPNKTEAGELAGIKQTAKKIQEESEYLVCIRIDGSYLGHRAINEALHPRSETKIIYAGNSLSRRELDRALEKVGDHDFSITVISKSGTTLEPAIALLDKYDKPYDVVYTNFVGTIIYEDDWQIAVSVSDGKMI